MEVATKTTLIKRVGPWVAATVLLVAAWLVQYNTPDEYLYQEPFVTHTVLGEQGAGRNIAVTIEDVRTANRVSDANGFSVDGTWVVIDLNAEAVRTQGRASLRHATLRVGGYEYSASERLTSFLETSLLPGVPKTGSLAFEVAPELLGGPMEFSFALDPITMVDSVIEVRVRPDQVQHVTETELRPQWGWVQS